jgi:carboxypeptidase C (cathepsin A)
VEHRVAHVILIDQPAGVGFSYQDENTAPVGNEEEVSKDVDKFLQLFFADHPELMHNPFFLAGGSYGWIGQEPSSGFCDLAPSILHYNWF